MDRDTFNDIKSISRTLWRVLNYDNPTSRRMDFRKAHGKLCRLSVCEDLSVVEDRRAWTWLRAVERQVAEMEGLVGPHDRALFPVDE